jgi:AcrR family transcriptional regulator
LLLAAREVFAERGYAGAGTNEIVQRAGVTATALYHHFGSKAGLYTAVLEDSIDTIIAGMDAAIVGCTHFLDRLDAILEALGDLGPVNRSHSPFAISAPHEVRRHPELAAATAQLRRLGGTVLGASEVGESEERAFLERLVDAGADDEAPPPRALVAVCVTLIFGVTVLSITADDEDEYRQAIEALRRTVAGMLPGQRSKSRRAAKRLDSR